MEDLEEGYPGDEEEGQQQQQQQQEIVPNSSPTKTLGLAPGPGPRVTVRTGVGYTPGESPTKFSTKPSRMAEDAGRNSEASTSKRPSSSTVTATKGPSSSHNLGAANSTQQYQPLLLRSPFDPSPSKRPASGVVVNDTPPARKNPEAKQRTVVAPASAISASSKMAAGGRADVSADTGTPRRKSNMFKPKSKQPKPKQVEMSSEEEEKAKGPSFSDEHENQRSENEDDGPVPVPSSRGTSPDQPVEEEDDDVGWGDDVGQADSDRMDVDEGNVLLSSSKKKGKMRVMRTQDSDEEEFQIESQKGLMARRKKVVDAGAAVPTKNKDTAPETTMKNERVRKMWRGTSEEDESDDGAAYRHRKEDSKHAKEPKMGTAMRRLRDSISGKEDSSGAKVKEGVKKKPDSSRSRKPVEKSRKEEKASSGGEEEEEEEEDSEIAVTGTKSAGRSVTTSTMGRGTTTTEEGRERGKRGAAAQAAQRLHSIMPDANLFEEQKKKGKIRGEWEEQDGQKQSVAPSAKGKRRRGTEESDGDGQDDEDEGEKRKKRRSVGVEIKRERSGSIVDAGVRFIATKVNLTPQQLQGLRKLGIRSVDDAQSCTHLVSNSILRTEKFLCALSYGPKAVKSSWLTDCLAKHRVLDTKEYFLYDAAGERTYGVNLDHSLRRARENPGKLFEGHTFYLSPNLDPLRMTTLTNAIKAAGGSVQRIFPGVRSHYHSNSDQRLHQDLELHLDTKHFVSQEGDKDADRWSELTTRGVPVYSSDFVLSAILKQQMGDSMDRKVMLAKPST
ncbi:hypothetical protein FRC20_003758 [Serendipita sp. 405]|nr:hypothetical protein FRC20_003758 [Serendipita sp. 405]